VTPDLLRARLGLRPHPEGGYYAETYRAEERIGSRSLATAIYYLLTPETFSALHRLRSDEIFHFYGGDPVEMLQLRPDGSGREVVLGSSVLEGSEPQVVVGKGVWQGLRLRVGGTFALLGATVAPGFDFADFELGRRDTLVAAYPAYADRIRVLTRAE
jgi:predicted cupin superfamily sugar epimerase